jgi:hypothetical protein
MTKGGPLATTVEDTALAHILMGSVNKEHHFASNMSGGELKVFRIQLKA